MRIDKLPDLIDLKASNGLKAKIYSYVMALFLVGGLDEARLILDALKDILAVVENGIYREERREAIRRNLV